MQYDTIPSDILVIPQGGRYVVSWNCTDENMTPIHFTAEGGWIARMQIRDTYGGGLLTGAHSDPAKAWGGVITFDDIGNVVATFGSAVTTLLTPTTRAVFDLELIDPIDGEPSRVVQGSVAITPEVTTDV